MEEIWKSVQGYEGFYEISNTGIVRGVDRYVKAKDGKTKHLRVRTVKTRVNNCGYLIATLSRNNQVQGCLVHRLIAEAFISNPLNKPSVNHKNGVKIDNSIENLEWTTYSENMLHAYRVGLRGRSCKKVVDTCTGRKFSSIKEASEHHQISYSCCKSYLSGNRANPTCLRYAA